MGGSKIDLNDTLVLFADLQAGIADLPLTISYERLQKGVLALARLAKIFDLPAVISAIAGGDGSPAHVMPEIALGLGELPIHHRTTAESFDNPAIKAAIEQTGRRTILADKQRQH